MARIAGINIPPHQHADIGLTSIYGIGRARARAILDAAGVPYDKKVKELNDAEVERIRESMARAMAKATAARGQLSIKRLLIWELIAGWRQPARPAGSWPAHADQRPHPQGSAQGRCVTQESSSLGR